MNLSVSSTKGDDHKAHFAYLARENLKPSIPNSLSLTSAQPCPIATLTAERQPNHPSASNSVQLPRIEFRKKPTHIARNAGSNTVGS